MPPNIPWMPPNGNYPNSLNWFEWNLGNSGMNLSLFSSLLTNQCYWLPKYSWCDYIVWKPVDCSTYLICVWKCVWKRALKHDIHKPIVKKSNNSSSHQQAIKYHNPFTWATAVNSSLATVYTAIHNKTKARGLAGWLLLTYCLEGRNLILKLLLTLASLAGV